jgi:hypothetical protein
MSAFPPPLALLRAPRESSVPDRRPSVKDTRCGSPGDGVQHQMARDLGASHRRTADQGRVHSRVLVEASTYSGSLPWSVSNQPNAFSTQKGTWSCRT